MPYSEAEFKQKQNEYDVNKRRHDAAVGVRKAIEYSRDLKKSKNQDVSALDAKHKKIMEAIPTYQDDVQRLAIELAEIELDLANQGIAEYVAARQKREAEALAAVRAAAEKEAAEKAALDKAAADKLAAEKAGAPAP